MKLDIHDIVDRCSSYADGEAQVRSKYRLSLERLTEIMLDQGYEKCKGCSWYVECGELTSPIDGELDGHCENCRPREKKEVDYET